jgi:hypothetical protein
MLSREFLLKRGYCCYLGCFNCPYNEQPEGLTNDPESVKLESNDNPLAKKEKQ